MTSADAGIRVKAHELAQISLRQRLRYGDVAEQAVSPARPDSWITGQVLGIGGGYSVV